jgi:glycosyltransferase involved in cell wall biosynthesis
MQSPGRSGAGKPSLAVLCPVFNEQLTIPLFFDRIANIFAQIEERYEPRLYFIDNGCSDGSRKIIQELHKRYPNVFVIVLSRNFGYQCALEAGLVIATADLYVMIDVDCEDPPDMLIDFLRFREEGYDIVYGERVDRPENAVVKSLRRFFYRVSRWVADDNFVLDMAEFSLITAEVRDAIIRDSTSFPFLRASIGRVGFLRKAVPYKRSARIAGVTHYNFFGMAVFAIAGILSASTLALRIPAYLFPFWAAGMIGIAILAVAAPATWQIPALLVAGFLFTGFGTTAIGLYVARIYKNGLNRPNVIVRYRLSILPPGEFPR